MRQRGMRQRGNMWMWARAAKPERKQQRCNKQRKQPSPDAGMVLHALHRLGNNRVNLYPVRTDRLERVGKVPFELFAFASKQAGEIICINAALANFTAEKPQDCMPAEREQS